MKTKHENILAWLDETEEEYLRLEPRENYDPCIVGIVTQFHRSFPLYSVRRIIEMHMKDGMSYDEAVEYFEYNTIGGWYGERTPIFLYDMLDFGTIQVEENTTEMT